MYNLLLTTPHIYTSFQDLQYFEKILNDNTL